MRSLLAVLCLVLALAPATHGQLLRAGASGVTESEGEKKAWTPPTEKELAELKTKLEDDLVAARRRLEAATTSVVAVPATTDSTEPAAPPPRTEESLKLEELLDTEIETLERLELQIGQLDTELEAHDGVQADLEEQSRQLEAMQAGGPEDPPPYSFLRLDDLEDRLVGQRRQRDAFATAVAIARQGVASAEDTLRDAEAGRRQAKEAADAAADDDPAARMLVQEHFQAAALESRQAWMNLSLRLAELRNQKLRMEVFQVEVKRLEAERDWVVVRTEFTAEHLAKKIEQLEGHQKRLQDSAAKARTDLRVANRQWNKLRTSLEKKDDPSLRLQEAARRSQVNALRLQITLQQRWSEWLLAREGVWQKRFELRKEVEPDAELRRTWSAETEAALTALSREERLQNARLSDIRKDLLDVEQSLEAERAEGEKVNWWADFRRKQLDRILGLSLEHLEAIAVTRRTWQKLAEELAEKEGGILDYDYWGEAKAAFSSVWDFELMAVEDRSVTIGKLVIALLLFLAGYWVSGRLSTRTARWLEERFELDEGASAGIESILFYLLVVIFTLLALQVAAVPLTVFAFLGGALAIGIGFGSQNLVNNFISGLILLVERPIRVGDRVEVDTVFGQVTRVGARCTRIRTPTNIEVLVPNSYFLESSMVNWTLSDQRVRLDVPIGVAYGSDLQLVKRLLLGAAEAHGLVLKKPDPVVVFLGHGASSLDLELRVWVKMIRGMTKDQVPSDLRFMVDLAFRDNHIEIPFPQRDLNLDRPLEVRILEKEPEASEDAGASGDDEDEGASLP
jgi:small-conductance mechanosensitive channel